jgi:hypothetical protein
MFAASFGVKSLVPNVNLNSLEQGSSQYWAVLEQKAAGRNRVLIMTTMFAALNLAMSYVPTTPLDPKTGKPNGFWMSPEMKATFMQVFASDSRIVSNVFGNVGKWRDDLVFEFIFDILRYTVDIGIMSTVFGASLKIGNTVIVDNSGSTSPAFAYAIFRAQGPLLAAYAPQVPTYAALDALEASTSSAVDDAKAAHGFISDFNYYLAIGNGLNGAIGIQQGILSATGTSIEVGASILAGLDARFGALVGSLYVLESSKPIGWAFRAAYAYDVCYLFYHLTTQWTDAYRIDDHAFRADPNYPTKPG